MWFSFWKSIVRRVLHHILTILRFGPLPNAMCYDCACTLKLFINKHFGSDDLKSTDFTRFLASLTMAIDRFHVKNHKRAMCKSTMRPDHPCHKDIYTSINTQVAEQLFAYLSKFKHSFRGYNYPKSAIFFTILFHLKNCVTTGVSSYEQADWNRMLTIIFYRYFSVRLLLSVHSSKIVFYINIDSMKTMNLS